MDKETRLGRFDKWGYKNSFSKGELARELTCMNRDYDELQQQCKKQKEVIEDIKKELLERNILDILPFDVAEKLCYLLKEVSE